jgi:hypothetical protein
VQSATYDTLVIGADPLKSDFFKRMVGDVTVNSQLIVEEGIQFESEIYNLNVLGEMLVQGTFRDDKAAGVNTINTVKFDGGNIGGNGSNFGTTNITTLDLTEGSGSLSEGTISISGTTTISAGQTLTLNNAVAPKPLARPISAPGEPLMSPLSATSLTTYSTAQPITLVPSISKEEATPTMIS